MTSLIGIILGFAAIILGLILSGANLLNYLDPVSFMMVFVPTIGSLITAFPLSLLTKVPAHFKVLMGKEYLPEDLIVKVLALSRKTRSEGLLSIENEVLGDPILDHGIRMIVDGVPELEIKRSLEDALSALKDRHGQAVSLYEKAAAFAPGYGMVGTVVGLINMLNSLDFSDSNAMNMLGYNMGIALITTLYGSLLANVIFIPVSNRLRYLHKKELFGKTLICNGLLYIARGENPGFIREALIGQLNKAAQKNIPESAGK